MAFLNTKSRLLSLFTGALAIYILLRVFLSTVAFLFIVIVVLAALFLLMRELLNKD
jgi:hypothetical protein